MCSYRVLTPLRPHGPDGFEMMVCGWKAAHSSWKRSNAREQLLNVEFKSNWNITCFCPSDAQWTPLVPTMCLSWARASANWTAVRQHLAPPTHMLLRCASPSSPRINVLLCHHWGYDLCNAAERVSSVKSKTRSILGGNVLAGARHSRDRNNKFQNKKKNKKEICQRASQASTPDSSL